MPTSIDNSSRPIADQPRNTDTSVSNPIEDPIIAQNPYNVGPFVGDRVNALRDELGPSAISRKSLRDRIFNFAEDTVFGVRLEEKAYDAKDAYIQECPVRRVVAENMRKQGGGRKVSFLETAGMIEIQGGFIAPMTLFTSLYGGVSMNYGFTASSMMRYRSSIPKLLGFGERPEGRLQDPRQFFPRSANAAMQLAPGSEYELAGKGRLLVNTAVPMRGGLGVDHASVGGGLVVSGTVTKEHETSLNVLALDKPGMVRVTLRNLDEETATILARLRAGVMFGAGVLDPGVMGGFLRYYAEREGAPNLAEFLMLYTTLYATFSARAAHRGLTIGSWDLDLTTAEGQEAYEHLLRLNTLKAEELAQSGNQSVTAVHFNENQNEYKFAADIGAIGLKFFIYESLCTEREGKLDESNKKTEVYRDSMYTRRMKSPAGVKEINWEAVTINDGERHGKEPFLRIHFEKRDWDFATHTVDKMLRFAQALHMPRVDLTGEDDARFQKARLDLCKRAEVKISADVYFTTKGVDKIDDANAEQGKAAFLKAASFNHERLKGFDLGDDSPLAVEARQRLDAFRKLSFWDKVRNAAVHKEEYLAVTGRALEDDLKLMKDAEAFGQAIDRMHSSSSSREEIKAFVDFAHSKGFHYMDTVAALSALAGREETLVNSLSISSGGITIKHVSEGSIRAPQDEVIDELYRPADPTHN